jgi:hypothetical protein
MTKWNGYVELDAMLNNMGWNSFEIGIIPRENVLISRE